MLTSQELSVFANTEFLLVKQQVLEKLRLALFQLQPQIREAGRPFATLLPKHLSFGQQKIAKGENYRGLPYLLMDFPSILEQKDILSIRSMIWWGNFASCTLHLQGKYWELYRERLLLNLPFLNQETYFFCVGPTPWEYHFRNDNYLKLSATNLGDLPIKNRDFVKISRQLPIDRISELPSFILSTTSDFFNLLTQ